MIIVLKDNPDQKQLENLVSWLKSMGLDIHMSQGQSATIMGLIFDPENRVQLLIDEDVLGEEYFACHPCVNTSSIRLKTEDVLGKFLEAVHHDYITVKLSR